MLLKVNERIISYNEDDDEDEKIVAIEIWLPGKYDYEEKHRNTQKEKK